MKIEMVLAVQGGTSNLKNENKFIEELNQFLIDKGFPLISLQVLHENYQDDPDEKIFNAIKSLNRTVIDLVNNLEITVR